MFFIPMVRLQCSIDVGGEIGKGIEGFCLVIDHHHSFLFIAFAETFSVIECRLIRGKYFKHHTIHDVIWMDAWGNITFCRAIPAMLMKPQLMAV